MAIADTCLVPLLTSLFHGNAGLSFETIKPGARFTAVAVISNFTGRVELPTCSICTRFDQYRINGGARPGAGCCGAGLGASAPDSIRGSHDGAPTVHDKGAEWANCTGSMTLECLATVDAVNCCCSSLVPQSDVVPDISRVQRNSRAQFLENANLLARSKTDQPVWNHASWV